MTRISMLVPEADLALIDAVAEPNRTAFMLAAAKAAALRVQRKREDIEIARILDEQVDQDRELMAEFACTSADGLDERDDL
ncbi:MAG: hypothetical protein GIW95_09595 [Candidatus Eremiobacteraeota bacterium]|nr:hypothetical protein [Candidatus Eremiobacteraeota bacterium]